MLVNDKSINRLRVMFGQIINVDGFEGLRPFNLVVQSLSELSSPRDNGKRLMASV